MTSSPRSLQGRIGAYAMHSRNDSRVVTAPARAAFLARFEDEVDPDRELPEAERLRRATMARKAYFARLAYQSSVARAKKKGVTSAKRVTPQEADRDAVNRRPSA